MTYRERVARVIERIKTLFTTTKYQVYKASMYDNNAFFLLFETKELGVALSYVDAGSTRHKIVVNTYGEYERLQKMLGNSERIELKK